MVLYMYIVRLRLPSENYLTVLPGSTLQVCGRWVGSARYVITLTSHFKIFLLIFIPLNKKWVRIFVLWDFILQILKGIPSIHTDLFKQNYRSNTNLFWIKYRPFTDLAVYEIQTCLTKFAIFHIFRKTHNGGSLYEYSVIYLLKWHSFYYHEQECWLPLKSTIGHFLNQLS